jgi:VWFA-related protein
MTAAIGVAPTAPTPKDAQQPGVSFRSAITLVPVDVRVIDKQGNPVTDLKQEDFTILEEGVRQNIRHFSLQVLAPEQPPPAGALPIRKAVTPSDAAPSLTPQHGRVFLLVLGRGRLQEPSKALDALLHFVRVQLLPQDRVAVLAYDRATDFTTNHDQVWQLIERLRDSHERIEALLAQQFGGLAAVYGSMAMPPELQTAIAGVFRGAGGLASRQLMPSEVADAQGLADATRRATDGAMDAAIQKAAADAGLDAPPSRPGSAADQTLTDLPFEEFVARNAGTMQDLSKIYTGIAYMRFLEGEKHLAFFTERGLNMLRGDDVDRIAEVANDARVVIDNFQTGGVMSGFSGSFAARDLRSLSVATGGQASIGEYTRAGLERMDLATRAGYLLGYYPARPLGDGGYRNLVVRVDRPGVTVLYRHGYFARLSPPAFDRRKFLTDNRVVSAALYRQDIRDIAIKVDVTRIPGKRGVADEMVVEASIDTGRIAFTRVDGKQVGALTVAVFFADAKKMVVQERSQTIDLKLPPASYQRVQREGIPYRLQMPVKDSVRIVKIVVYNYEKDTIGSAEVLVK